MSSSAGGFLSSSSLGKHTAGAERLSDCSVAVSMRNDFMPRQSFVARSTYVTVCIV